MGAPMLDKRDAPRGVVGALALDMQGRSLWPGPDAPPALVAVFIWTPTIASQCASWGA